MRWFGVLALVCACGGKHAPPAPTGVGIGLDIEEGTALAPSGATAVELVLHERGGDGALHDVVLSTNLTPNPNHPGQSSFDFSGIDPSDSVAIEATLRNDIGAAVGYGRTDTAAALAGGADITIKVRRPIVYIAGTVSRDADGNPNTTPLHWTEAPATFSDLSAGASLDGKSTVGSNAVMMIGAGHNLYMVTQATSDPNGVLTGLAKVIPIATGDHSAGAALTGTMTGAVLDGAGADDGTTLVVGTTTQLFMVDAITQVASPLADGSFSRVAILSTVDGHNARTLAAIAIRNRGATTGTCASTAELWWAPLVASAPSGAHMIATGGFSDVATDRGQAYYVDACKGELGKVTETAAMPLRSIPGTGTGATGGPGKPTALAVSNGQAYVGVESPAVGSMTPATTSLLALPTDASSATVRTLWTEGAQQVLDVVSFPDVRRQLSASSVVFGHLEIGAGGDYVALTTSAHFHGAEIGSLGIPDMTIDTEELRVFSAATGAIVQRYRSWCDGVLLLGPGDISGWECAAAAGQSAPAADPFEHHIGSMTFLFGKR